MNARLLHLGLLGILSVLAQIVVTSMQTKDAFNQGKSTSQSGIAPPDNEGPGEG
jgi:hypothetical protein